MSFVDKGCDDSMECSDHEELTTEMLNALQKEKVYHKFAKYGDYEQLLVEYNDWSSSVASHNETEDDRGISLLI